jgi:transaldolase
MKIFVDTAEINEIKLAISWGIVDGVTTNPSLIKKAVDKREGKISMDEYIEEIITNVPGPVSLEVIALKEEEMLEQARILYNKFNSFGEVVIKIPVNTVMGEEIKEFEGLRTIKTLSEEGIPTNVTLIMSATQALLAAKVGATYVSPFAGRIDDYLRTELGLKIGIDFQKRDYYDIEKIRKIVDTKFTHLVKQDSILQLYQSTELNDIGQDNGVYSGVDLVKRILKIYQNYGYKTEVIAASIRNGRQVMELAELGVHIATIPFNVLKEMIHHYKTVEGMKNFTADIVPAYEKVFELESS